jgi:hypothetical protein
MFLVVAASQLSPPFGLVMITSVLGMIENFALLVSAMPRVKSRTRTKAVDEDNLAGRVQLYEVLLLLVIIFQVLPESSEYSRR